MSVKIRLQRRGKKAKPFYHIVVADARAPRDGKFIEKLGTYNPNTNPATIEINREKAATWLDNGAQPTDTCRAILSYKGVLYLKHLKGGLKKGALTEEQVKTKMEEWLTAKESKVDAKRAKIASTASASKKAAFAAEQKAKEEKAKAVAAKALAALEAEAPVAEEAPAAEETAEAPVAEATATEETPAAESTETPEAPAETNE